MAPGWCNGMYYDKNLIQYDQLAYMARYFLENGDRNESDTLISKMLETSYEN